MDTKVQEKIEDKIKETLTNVNEISLIEKSLEELSIQKNSFTYGILIGRLYNSFYYQCKRILKREPSKQEFDEFLEILKKYELEFKEKLGK